MKYRKVIEVDARQFPPLTSGWHEFDPLSLDQLTSWCGGHLMNLPDRRPYIVVPTLQGEQRAWPGDWIIQGVQGEFYPVKDAIFTSSYQPVQEQS